MPTTYYLFIYYVYTICDYDAEGARVGCACAGWRCNLITRYRRLGRFRRRPVRSLVEASRVRPLLILGRLFLFLAKIRLRFCNYKGCFNKRIKKLSWYWRLLVTPWFMVLPNTYIHLRNLSTNYAFKANNKTYTSLFSP